MGYKAKGSIYESRRKPGKLSYVAEINFYGHRIRRESTDRTLVEDWLQDSVTTLNELLSEYENDLSLSIREAREKAYEKFQEKLKPVLSAVRAHDTRYRDSARAKGIIRNDHFQTYLVLDEESKLVKIGKSHDIYTRMSVMGREGRVLLGYCDKDIEVKLHEDYRKKRFSGEWFRLSESDINEIITLYNFVDARC